MLRLAVIIVVSGCLAACTAVPANYTAQDAPQSNRHFALSTGRPIVALALGSGGPRGFTHVGVLKVLDGRGDPVVASSFALFSGLSDDYKRIAIRKGEESAREVLPRIRALFNRR